MPNRLRDHIGKLQISPGEIDAVLPSANVLKPLLTAAVAVPRGQLRSIVLVAALLYCYTLAWGQGTRTVTQSLTAQVVPAASITVSPSTLNLTEGGPTFSSFTTATPLTVNFMIRTTQSSGSGTITVRAAQFAPTGGPTVSGSNLTCTCVSSTLGTCPGTQNVSTSSTVTVLNVPASSCTGSGCSGSNPQSARLSFTLVNQPQYKVGSYSAVLTFTISAT